MRDIPDHAFPSIPTFVQVVLGAGSAYVTSFNVLPKAIFLAEIQQMHDVGTSQTSDDTKAAG
jgi:hypothetical protein